MLGRGFPLPAGRCFQLAGAPGSRWAAPLATAKGFLLAAPLAVAQQGSLAAAQRVESLPQLVALPRGSLREEGLVGFRLALQLATCLLLVAWIAQAAPPAVVAAQGLPLLAAQLLGWGLWQAAGQAVLVPAPVAAGCCRAAGGLRVGCFPGEGEPLLGLGLGPAWAWLPAWTPLPAWVLQLAWVRLLAWAPEALVAPAAARSPPFRQSPR